MIAGDFIPDGAWRDIYILKGSSAVWESVWLLLKNDPDALEFWIDGEPGEPPNTIGDIFDLKSSHELFARYKLDSISLNCHFFSIDEVEFDLDPQEVFSEQKATILAGFLETLGRTTSQRVILTHENLRDLVIAQYDSATDRVIWSSNQ